MKLVVIKKLKTICFSIEYQRTLCDPSENFQKIRVINSEQITVYFLIQAQIPPHFLIQDPIHYHF